MHQDVLSSLCAAFRFDSINDNLPTSVSVQAIDPLDAVKVPFGHGKQLVCHPETFEYVSSGQGTQELSLRAVVASVL